VGCLPCAVRWENFRRYEANATEAALFARREREARSAVDTSARQGGGGQTVPASTELSAEEVENLLFVREEEKLARDVYLALAEKWDAPIFSNIAQSEQQHMDAVGQLIEKYGLEDPIVDDTPGVFTNGTLQRLYTDLVGSDEANLDYLVTDLKIDGGDMSELAAVQEWS
jgi:hypothetical protein